MDLIEKFKIYPESEHGVSSCEATVEGTLRSAVFLCKRAILNNFKIKQFQAKPSQSFGIGQYKIDIKVPADIDLLEFPAEEHSKIGKLFNRQQNFHAPAVLFLGFKWTVVLCTVNDVVCRVKFTALTETLTETIQAMTLIQDFCLEEYGVPEKKPREALWRTTNSVITHKVHWAASPYCNEISIISKKMFGAASTGELRA